ncbi:MAG: hypothetical protein A2664_02450 [Candidatus Taylorbacteria bacterium RIFCSPHIGHO2_01_FULL_46_22b]|uniref:ATP synthase subunit b n=1 Tax=Candidatus Taylorbacteria bacterium RIFCSPHIGHO2_01_FULL_46_22b TaxID=1802301 RepID=A0A1G2M5B1_9BACT|nr:MAG: hypothetical protein A2664_02450 [Candidatus Taylorbacteria bacterium RIFCSPHIGHO2_01_FULL_46_22b]
MEDLFHNLGIDWKILVAQIVNFTILVFVLTKFLYRPLLGMLNRRRDEIKKSAEKTVAADKLVAEIERQKEEVLAKARTTSSEMIKKAETQATGAAEKIMTDAQAEAKRIAADERKKLASEHDALMQEATRSLGATVIRAVEQSVGDVLDEKAKGKLVEQAMQKVQVTART